MTRVVNLRLNNYDLYIGRAGRGQDGRFGNPFPISSPKYKDLPREKALEECLADYRSWFILKVECDLSFRAAVLALKDKRLGCFCAPAGGFPDNNPPWRCHGQILANWIDSQG